MEKFQTDPMMDSLEIRRSNTSLDLPRFYLCPSWKSFNNYPARKNNEDDLYEQLYEWDFQSSAFTKNQTYPDGLIDTVSLEKFFMRNAPSCESVIRNATLMVGQTKLNCSSFEIKSTAGGICCTLQLPGQFSNDLISYFSFSPSTFPIRMYATFDRGTELLRHLRLHNFLFATSIMVETQETRISPSAKVLARSQRKCFFPGEQQPYVECVLNCRVKKCLRLCGCVPWYLARNGAKECQISKYKCLDSNSQQIIDSAKCNCRQSCNNIVLRHTEVVIPSPEEPCVIKIKEKSALTFKRTVRFGWGDLFVSFGGIAGLFLGLSLLSIIEFGYYFSLRTYCGAVLSAPKRRYIVTKINVRQPPNPTCEGKHAPVRKYRVKFHDYVN